LEVPDGVLIQDDISMLNEDLSFHPEESISEEKYALS